jgi:hypothetical protein
MGSIGLGWGSTQTPTACGCLTQSAPNLSYLPMGTQAPDTIKRLVDRIDRCRIERQISATDKQIDSLVYELYGLTESEIRIVEGGGK